MDDRELTFSQTLGVKAGSFLEKKLDQQIRKRFEAPELEGEPEVDTWYRVSIPEGMSGDGSEYHIYVKKGTSPNLCVFLSGGGVAWNAYTAARPVTGAKKAAGLPNFYWNNLRPVTQMMNINIGITDIGNSKNPFHAWNFVVIAYATGDFHVGDADFEYLDEEGNQQVLHFHGHKNFLAAMKRAKQFFPEPQKLLIAGDSAGAFAVPALAGEIVEDYYPDCDKVTLLSDSGQILYRHWRKTAREIWQAEESVWKSIHSSNITVDWYKALYEKLGDRVQYLYAGSTRDHLLTAYFNDVANKSFTNTVELQEVYYEQMKHMVKQLYDINPNFGFFIYDWNNSLRRQGGTVHTAVRKWWYYSKTETGRTMAEWLGRAAIAGHVDSFGLELLYADGKIK